MPTYKFLDKNTGKEFLEFMSISALGDYLAANPHLEQRVHGAPMISSHRGGDRAKPDGGFTEVLQKIAEHHPQSELADRYMKKSIKQLKTEEVMKKHRKRSNTK